MNVEEFIQTYTKAIDATSLTYLNQLNLAVQLNEAMLYSYQAGGKRLRPLLLLAVLAMYQIDVTKGLKSAASLELIHTSSLIHDDLPAMDNDDYRRGQLANHKRFNEATAILAGDALLINAFELIVSDDRLNDHEKVKLTQLLSQASGANGMVGGQMLDLENELSKTVTIEQLGIINYHKTGKLLEFALVGGGIISGVNTDELNALKLAAKHIGIAFQIKDDMLDVIGDSSRLGKKVNSDEKNNKTTYVDLLGLEQATFHLTKHYKQALAALDTCKGHHVLLSDLFKLIIERDY